VTTYTVWAVIVVPSGLNWNSDMPEAATELPFYSIEIIAFIPVKMYAYLGPMSGVLGL
jgi:hypothetical protein